MTIGGICKNCGKYSPGLFRCHACSSMVGPDCMMPNGVFCMVCKGRKIR